MAEHTRAQVAESIADDSMHFWNKQQLQLVEPILSQYFSYDGVFALSDYDHDMTKLYTALQKLQKQSYDPNYRFIFSYFDTDYFISNDQPGLTLRNLQRLTRTLDISNYFCLIITQQKIQAQLEVLKNQETTDVHSISSITTLLQNVLHFSIGMVSSNTDLICKKYICLNRIPRFHRTILYAYLFTENLLDCGIVSYGVYPKTLHQHSQQKNHEKFLQPAKHPESCRFLYTDNWTRINEFFPVGDNDLRARIARTPMIPYQNFKDTHGLINDLAIDLSQMAFLYIVTETVFHYPTFVLGEKTIKPIVAKRPFVLVSSPGSLRVLKDAGFKTFDRWWDESYDDILDPVQRMTAIFRVIDKITARSIAELKQWYNDMQEVCDHNFEFYQNHLRVNETVKFKQGCQINLGQR